MSFFACVLWSCSAKDQSKSAIAEFEKNHRAMLLENESRTNLILKDSFSFQGLELIYVGMGKKYYSYWGHALIRFVGSSENPNEDLTLSFIADFNDYNLDNIKAYFGGYDVLTIIKPLSKYMEEYIQEESREMRRYIIQSTQEQRDKFLSVIRHWIIDSRLAGPYTFRSNNCSGLIMKSLERSGISKISNYETYPFDMPFQFYEDEVIKLPPIKLSYKSNPRLNPLLYQECQSLDCEKYYDIATKFYKKEELDSYYDYGKMRHKKELSLYPIRFFKWAYQLIMLLFF